MNSLRSIVSREGAEADSDRRPSSSVRGIRVKSERSAGEGVASAGALNACCGPRDCSEACIRNTSPAADTGSVLSLVNAFQCSLDLDDGLQVALQLAHRHVTVRASGSDTGVIFGIGIYRQFLPGAVNAVLVGIELCHQSLAINPEIACVSFARIMFRSHQIEESPPACRVTDETDYFRLADKPSGGELITGFERYGDLSPTIGFVLRLHVRGSIQ